MEEEEEEEKLEKRRSLFYVGWSDSKSQLLLDPKSWVGNNDRPGKKTTTRTGSDEVLLGDGECGFSEVGTEE